MVAERLIETWPNIEKTCKFWDSLPKSKRPSSKSYLNLQNAVQDDRQANIFQFLMQLFGTIFTRISDR